MSLKHQFAQQGVEWRQFEYDDGTELVADFGPGGEPSVDSVGDTVIVVDGDDHYEFESDGGTQVEMRNGVLTVEVDE